MVLYVVQVFQSSRPILIYRTSFKALLTDHNYYDDNSKTISCCMLQADYLNRFCRLQTIAQISSSEITVVHSRIYTSPHVICSLFIVDIIMIWPRIYVYWLHSSKQLIINLWCWLTKYIICNTFIATTFHFILYMRQWT